MAQPTRKLRQVGVADHPMIAVKEAFLRTVWFGAPMSLARLDEDGCREAENWPGSSIQMTKFALALAIE